MLSMLSSYHLLSIMPPFDLKWLSKTSQFHTQVERPGMEDGNLAAGKRTRTLKMVVAAISFNDI